MTQSNDVICPRCHGTGNLRSSFWTLWTPIPCSDCEGSGVLHCCDGLQEQAEHAAGRMEQALDQAPGSINAGVFPPRQDAPCNCGTGRVCPYFATETLRARYCLCGTGKCPRLP